MNYGNYETEGKHDVDAQPGIIIIYPLLQWITNHKTESTCLSANLHRIIVNIYAIALLRFVFQQTL
jgi:hypothetical protein